MARNDEFYLNKWVKYYGSLLGEENLYIYLDGLDQKAPSGDGRANVVIVEKQGIKVVEAEKRRLNFLSDRAAEMFAAGYDLVIGADSDEFLICDPKTGKTLPEYLSSIKINTVVGGLGLDIGEHLKNEKPFNPEIPIMDHRSHALISSKFTKASVISCPVRWGRGFHRVRGHMYHIDPNLYLLHCGNTDYKMLLAKHDSADIIARKEQKHFRRSRMRVVHDITAKRAIDGDKVFRLARNIQRIFKPLYAWNKPSMLKMRWVVKLPSRFKKAANI